jgi:hypothetical protein
MVKRVRPKRKGKGGGDDVGYGKPPKHSQFKPGQSGNPKGRPKGTKNFKTEILDKLNSPIKVNQNGRVRKITTQRAGIEVLFSKAMHGDARAIGQFLRLAEKYGEPTSEADDSISSEDQALLEDYVKRHKEA